MQKTSSLKLKKMTEKKLGKPIRKNLFEEALNFSKSKLEWIINREGDLDGVRLEPWYIVELITEYIIGSILSENIKRAPCLPASAPNTIYSTNSLSYSNSESKGGVPSV